MILQVNRRSYGLKIIAVSVVILANYFGPTSCDKISNIVGDSSDENRRGLSVGLSHRSRRSHVHRHHQPHHNHRQNNDNENDYSNIPVQMGVESTHQLDLDRQLEESVLQEQKEDRNELEQLQSTETATFLSVPLVLEKTVLGVGVGIGVGVGEQKGEENVIGIAHEKHHLWKLTIETEKNENEGENPSSIILGMEDQDRNVKAVLEHQTNPIPDQNQVKMTMSNPAHPVNHHTLSTASLIPNKEFLRLNSTTDSLVPAEIIRESTNARVSNGTDYELGQEILRKRVHLNLTSESMPKDENTNANPYGGNSNSNGGVNGVDLQIGNNEIFKQSTAAASSLPSSSSPSSLTSESNSPNNAKVGCRSCILNKELEAEIPQASLREMRLELIKEQILRKLGLKEPPNATYLAKETLPLPVAQGNTLPKRHGRHAHMRTRDKDIEDFYGKTEQVIVFPEDVMPVCETQNHRADASVCFTFNLPQGNRVDVVSSAQLWVYNLADKKDRRNQGFWVDEVTVSPDDGSARAINIDIVKNMPVKDGWMKMNLTRILPKWMSSNDTEHVLQIGCKTCMEDPSELPIDVYGDQRPFIVINYRSVSQKKRSRRNVNCSPRLTECCREPFVVSFREIGWDSWIISPEKYDAFYCTGSCVNINGISHSSDIHTTIMQRYIRTFGMTNRTAKIVPCCAASKMSSISLIYRDHLQNHTLKHEKLPNMVVESCGCV